MSVKSARLFLEQMKTDEVLWKSHTNAKSKSERHQLYKNLGFNFTDKELRSAIDSLIKKLTLKRYGVTDIRYRRG